MNAVKNNPYRTLGLFGNSSEKELQKQIATIKRFAEVGKTKAFDYDFPFFGEVVRSTEKVQEAASKIEQAKNKVHYALFWFLNSGHIDEAALNNLKEGHIEKATEIWEKTLKDSTVTAKNFAAISNLSTLQLGIVTYNGSFDPEKFSASIDLKGKLLLSEVFNNFVSTVIGEGISLNRDIILKEFADEILQIVKPYLNKPNGIKSSQLINAFSSFPNEIKQYVSGKFTDRPVSNIENQIEKTKQYRGDNPNDAEEYGEELYKNTKEDLVFLKNVWGVNNVQYQMVVNKISNELLQCSIDFFNIHNKEGLFDPFDDSLKIAKYAKSLNPTGQVKNRVEEALETLEEMRYRDAHEIIGFFKQILGVFEEVEKENSGIEALLSGRRTVVNEDKIMEIARPLLDDQIVEKIAKSGKDNLIKDFYNSINKLTTKFSYRNSDFFSKKKTAFISYLPITNSIKFNFEKSKLENEINNLQKELTNTKNKKMYSTEIQTLENQMSSIKEWQMFRSRETRESQIAAQQQKINSLVSKGETEKKREISRIEEQLVIKRRELKNLTEQNN